MTSGCATRFESRKIASMSRVERIVRIARPRVVIVALSAQDLAALAPTARENRSAATGGHARTEAVSLAALPVVRLVRSLHWVSS